MPITAFIAFAASISAKTPQTRRVASLLLAASFMFTLFNAKAQPHQPLAPEHWVASWTASPQPVWGADFFLGTNIPAVVRDQTIRQVARISLGGRRLRLVLSNAYGRQPVVIGRVSVALAGDGPAIRRSSLRNVTFGGQASATLPAGAPLLSDPIDLPVSALSHLSISIYLPASTPITTFHWDGRQTAWIAAGDQSASSTMDTKKSATAVITSRTLLTGIDVQTGQPGARAVAAFGDSITDGNGATVDADARWPDFLADRLVHHNVAVINAGISGARLLSDKMGPNALARFGPDVLDQPGVRAVIVLLGINDISWPGTAFDPTGKPPTLPSLEYGFRQLIAQAHRKNVCLIGATLTPFAGALHDTPLDNYFNADKEALRQRLNRWIRTSGSFDAVLDFDLWARDPRQPTRLAARFDSGDHLHPGDAGNRFLAESIALDVLWRAIGEPAAGNHRTGRVSHSACAR